MATCIPAPIAPIRPIDRGSGEPLHRQVYFAIRQAILDGRMPPGTRLPASRTLAQDLGVSRNTVTTAFEQLHAEGYVDTRVGSGSFVSRQLPQQVPGARPGVRPSRRAAETPRGPSARGAQLARLFGGRSQPRPFSPGLPELAEFPFEDWARLLARGWRRPSRAFLVGIDPAGYGPLCRAIADYLASARAVACRAEQVIIVSGTQQALDLTARVLLDPGDAVWIEEPGYPPTATVLLAAGARPVPVPVDREGLSVVAGRKPEPAARLACVSPSHQFPLGVTMSLKRRLELLDWAREADGFVFEDDYDSEYRYRGRPLAALQGLDRDGRVIYVGTMSKVMFPGLRIGYMIVPEHLIDAFLAVRALIDAHPSSIAQAALADFISEGHLAAHIRRMRSLYAARQQAMIEALRRRLDGVLRVAPAEAGMHLVAYLPPGTDDREVATAAAAAGIEAPPLSGFYQAPPERPGLLLGYAGVPEKEIPKAVDLLARSLESTFARRVET